MVDVLLIANMYCRCIGRGGEFMWKKKYTYDCHHVVVFFLIWGLHVDVLISYRKSTVERKG